MRSFRSFLPVLLGALALMPGVLAAATQPMESPPVEIFYIPRKDFSRLPDYSARGVFLPLSELLDLAKKAAGQPKPSGPTDSVYCTSMTLTGEVGEAMMLDGHLHFIAPAETWSAARIDDGVLSWIEQEAETDASVFLARVQGATYLYAKGPAEGRLRVRIQPKMEKRDNVLDMKLGCIQAPCRIDLHPTPGMRLLPSPLPVQSAGAAQRDCLRLFPAYQADAQLSWRLDPELRLSPDCRIELVRAVTINNGALELGEEFTLQGNFEMGKTLEWKLPHGLQPLRMGSPNPLRLEITSDTLRICFLERSNQAKIHLVFSVPFHNQIALLPAWDIPSVTFATLLHLQNTADLVVLAVDPPSSLVTLPGTPHRRSYRCWGRLPEMSVVAVRPIAELPPSLHATLTIERNQAEIRYELRLAPRDTEDFRFHLPAGWNLANIETARGDTPLPCTIQTLDGLHWMVAWNPGNQPDRLVFTLHRSGEWGMPGKATALEIPLVKFDPPRPVPYEIEIRRPDTLDLHATTLEQLTVLAGTDSSLLYRVAGNEPRGVLAIQGRDADVHARVVTSLQIHEDRVDIRCMLSYQIRHATAKSFRFALPPGTSSLVRIEGQGIRESTHIATPQADEWTVITQSDIAGAYQLLVSWSVAHRPGEQPFDAPQIIPREVSTQEGFLVLEGSETLRLDTHTVGLADADISELPALPWPQAMRILATFRYVEPPYSLQVRASRYPSEVPPDAIVREATLTTTLTPEGERLTQAQFTLIPLRDMQFFAVQLPEAAQLWSVFVNEEGVKPGRGKKPEAKNTLLVPLPAFSREKAEVKVTLVYRELAAPLFDSTRMNLAGPEVPFPVNRTVWNLNLPNGFEYLAYGGTLGGGGILRDPLVTFLRTAYYPSRLLFVDASALRLTIWTLIGFFLLYFILKPRRKKPVPPFIAAAPPDKTEPRPPKAGRKRGPLTSLFELLIVIAIIAILAAIAVPNFLEAQVRSKVSRSRTDHRSLATAIEAYYVDNNAYPPSIEILHQGAVKYLSTSFTDPYAASPNIPMRYLIGPEALQRAKESGLVPPDYQDSSFWIVYSVGPDGVDDGGRILYDPTNGTVSRGDIVRSRNFSTFQPRYTELKDQEIRLGAEIAQAPREPVLYDATLGTVSAGDVWRVKADGELPVDTDGDMRMAERQRGVAATTARPSTPAPALYGGFGASTVAAGIAVSQRIPPEDRARYSGLLSLSVEIPEGGIRRTFERLGGDAGMEIRFLDMPRFLRWKFVVWMSAFLLLCAVWIGKRGGYWRLWVFCMAVCLLTPLLMRGTWTVFFNAAAQGVLFSVIAPLLTWLGRRILAQPPQTISAQTSTLLVLLFLALHSPVRGESADAPLRILVPYTETVDPRTLEDPLAFLHREDFILLWNAAHPQAPAPAAMSAFVSALKLDGSLHPERSTIAGRFGMIAVNPSDNTTSLILSMGPLQFSELSSTPSGATLESRAKGYVLWMPPHWAGRLDALFEAPCVMNGLEGNWRIEWPEVAAGSWKIHFPYPEVLPQTTTPFLVESKEPGHCTVSGAVRQGTLELGWKVSTTERDAAQAADSSVRSEIHAETKIDWATPAYAEWSATLKIAAPTETTSLPEYVRFTVDSRLELSGADGPLLRSAVIEGKHLVLRFHPGRSAVVQLQGVVVPETQTPPTDTAKEFRSTWNVPGLRAEGTVIRGTSLRLNFAGTLELLRMDPMGLEQKSPGDAQPGFSTRLYESIAPDWSLRLELRRLHPVFKAEMMQLAYPTEGLVRQAGALRLIPESRLDECILRLSPNTRLLTLDGPWLAGWVQYANTVRIRFHPSLRESARLEFTADSDLQGDSTGLFIDPFDLPGAAEIRRSLVIARDPDEKLQEVDLAGATLRLPTDDDRRFLEKITNTATVAELELRAYQLQSSAPLVFQWVPIQATALTMIYNRVVVSNGLQTLDSVVVADPRQGRIREIETWLLLGRADSGVAARLQSAGPVRHLRTEIQSDTLVRIVAELTAPHSTQVVLRFSLTQPTSTDGNEPIRPTLLLPPSGGGERAFLQLRRVIEGELTPTQLAGAQPMDPAAIQWPDATFRALPSDLFYEINPETRIPPTFALARHAQGDVLRAVVEVLRQRTIYTEDGMQRNELEIVLQNQSEQFLRIAFPHAKSQMTLYDIQVAGRSVKPIFSTENGEEALFIPLNRTGLLEPELTVRVVYLVENQTAWRNRGTVQHLMPRILGGVPVAQSALVLMLPETCQYSKFDGSLNPVHMVDLEVDEALRRAKTLEKLSETVLYSRGDTQQKALGQLNIYKGAFSAKLKDVKQTTAAFERVSSMEGMDKRGAAREQKLAQERYQNIIRAEEAELTIGRNVEQLNEAVVQQAQQMRQTPYSFTTPNPFSQQQALPPSPPTPAALQVTPQPAAPSSAIEFPRKGEVFVFRQLQSTGDISFRYRSRASKDYRNDLILAVALLLMAGVILMAGGVLFRTRKRKALILALVCIVALFIGVAVDIAIPALAASLLLFRGKVRRNESV